MIEGRRGTKKTAAVASRFRLPPARRASAADESAGNDRLARRHGRRTQGARPDTSAFAEFTPPPLAIVVPDRARRRPLVFLHRLPTGEIARSILLGARETMFRPVPGELTSR